MLSNTVASEFYRILGIFYQTQPQPWAKYLLNPCVLHYNSTWQTGQNRRDKAKQTNSCALPQKPVAKKGEKRQALIKVDGKLLSVMRKAITDYNMIKDGDKIAVGLSGGKDSMVLAAALATYRIFSPQKFSLMAITIDLGFEGTDFSGLVDFCKAAEIEYHIEHTQIADVIFNIRKEPNPCSLCSKMRRGALSTVLNSHGYNKLALGHHGDDLAETLLLSLFYEGRLSTFAPVSFMDRTGVTLIRPFVYAKEKNIASAARNLPVLHNPCPVNHHTKREYVKELIKKLGADMPGVADRILGAITHPERNNLWDNRICDQAHTDGDDKYLQSCPADNSENT